MASPVIILDMDETLIHSVKKEGHQVNLKLCFLEIEDRYVYLRPHLYSFLMECFQITPFVILWSAGTGPYVLEILEALNVKNNFYRVITRCTYNMIHKNVDFLLSDDAVKHSSIVIFVDDKIHRIHSSCEKIIPLEIEQFKFSLNNLENQKEDRELITTLQKIKLLLNIDGDSDDSDSCDSKNTSTNNNTNKNKNSINVEGMEVQV